jgi:uncharacterized membrane protein
MKTRTVLISIMLAGVLLLLCGYVMGQSMGPNMATHWNAAGEADGYGTTFMALYFLPLLTMALSLLIIFIPAIDPLKANVAAFRSEYNLFVLVFAGFMYYIHGLSVAWNLGWKFSMNAMMAPAFGVLFIITGMVISKAKRNFFIGIKTPWTLSNDTVWEKTHRLGGRLFIASGILTAACVFYPLATTYVLLVTALGAALITEVYSYLEFRRIEKKAQLEK